MKINTWNTMAVLTIGLLSLWFLISGTAYAQNATVVTPTQITVAGVCGETITRTTLIQSTSSISDLQVIAGDLTSEKGTIIPASTISTTFPKRHLSAGEIVSATMHMNFDNIPAGTYKGEFLLTSSNNTIVLPVIVQVKHHWLWAFLLLLVGVMCSFSLTIYRQHIQPYDMIHARIGQFRTQIRNDLEFQKATAFQTLIESHLFTTETAIQDSNLKNAKSALANAIAVWQKWYVNRANWIAQLASADELRKKAIELKLDKCFYLEQVMQNLDEAIRDAPNLPKGVEELRSRIEQQRKAIEYYQKLYSLIEDLQTQSTDIDEELHKRTEPLPTRLCNLQPDSDDTSKLKELESDIDVFFLELEEKKAAQHENTQSTSFSTGTANAHSARGGIYNTFAHFLTLPVAPSLTTVNTLEEEEKVKRAVRRLQIAWYISSFFIIALLLLVGFGQLYGENPTFGTNIWNDYAALLAWGFGVETSRASIMDLGKDRSQG